MKLFRVRQKLVSHAIAEIPAAVRKQLDGLEIDVPGGEVAITAGSRGISNIATILRAAGEWLRDRGARPFVIPAMGSHNGATAEGQAAMLEALGITERSVEMPIRASMECVKIGTLDAQTALRQPERARSQLANDVWMDRFAYESAGVLVVNRIKLHTSFSAPVQSGLAKMMAVGLGKIGGARTFHDVPTSQLAERLLAMRDIVLASGKIWAGLAILEDGFDQTAELHAVRPDEIADIEPRLLERHQRYFPRLPLDDINVLVVDEIGKIYSGTGMDTNVIGFRGDRYAEDLDRPRIKAIAALNLAKASHGNALGLGLADFITRRLREAMDEEKTYLNAFTTGSMQTVKTPMAFRDDEELFARLAERFGQDGWIVIPNTLHLETVYASPDLREALEANPICEVEREPVDVTFAGGRHQLEFS
ncbi:MAG TPA: hypothetical protein VJ828_11210 [Lacipirellulaceae bacterium]|nr:hypothetical protein [Lacipirellulaceae bacterium]